MKFSLILFSQILESLIETKQTDSSVQLTCWGSQLLPLYMARKSRKEKCRSEEPIYKRQARH